MRQNTNEAVLNLYKPFRNKIRKLSIIDSFQFIWSLGNNLTADKPLPPTIQMRREFYSSSDAFKRKYWSVFEWELEFLFDEVILYSNENQINEYSLKKLKHLSKIINHLRAFSNELDKIYLTEGHEKTFQEFNRMSHRQFIWQEPPNTNSIYRYFRIYNDPLIEPEFNKYFGLTPLNYYLTGILICGFYLRSFSGKFNDPNNVSQITNDMIKSVLERYSSSINEIAVEIDSSREMNEKFFYGFNPIRAKPILKYKDDYFCPLPTLFLWQITNGVYYHLIKNSVFADNIGKAFENYVGYILQRTNTPEKFKIYPEKPYDIGKLTTDWIIEDASAFLFVECKAKRMTLQTKGELNMTDKVIKDLSIISQAVFQVYKTYLDFKKGKYNHIQYREEKKVYILILTLEEWYLEVNPFFQQVITSKVNEMFAKDGIDTLIITETPFYIKSINRFERDGQLIHSFGIHEYFSSLPDSSIIEKSKGFIFRNLTEEDFNKELFQHINKSD